MLWTKPGDVFLYRELDAALKSCFQNKMSDERDSGVEALGCGSHTLMARRTKADIGCASVTNSGEWRDRAGICWRCLAV